MEFDFNVGKARQAIYSLITLVILFLFVIEITNNGISSLLNGNYLFLIILLIVFFGFIFIFSRRIYNSYHSPNKIILSEDALNVPTFYLGISKIKLSDIYSIEDLVIKNSELLLLGVKGKGGQLIDCLRFVSMSDYYLFKSALKNRARNNFDCKASEIINLIISKKSIRVPGFTYIFLIICLIFFFMNYYSSLDLEMDSIFLNLGVGTKSVLQGKDFHRIFSSSLLHVNFLHLSVNIFAFSILGELLEKAFGHLRMINVFVISTFLGYIFFALFSGFNYGVGLSGSVFGLFGAYIAFRLRYEKYLPGSLTMMPLPKVLTLVVIEILVEYFFLENIDHYNHIGGFIAGFIYLYFAPLGAKLETIDQPVMVEKILCGGLVLSFAAGLGCFLSRYYGFI